VTPAEAGGKGRYKLNSDGKCVWDAKDDGPNQCTPPKLGRFKADGDKCVWDAKDDGPDQCKPKKGRFKKDGVNCVWAPNEYGVLAVMPRAVAHFSAATCTSALLLCDSSFGTYHTLDCAFVR